MKLTREHFAYDAGEDCFICPQKKKLPLRSLEREEYNVSRVYRASRQDCRDCPLLEQCASDSHHSRTIRVNLFEQAVERQR